MNRQGRGKHAGQDEADPAARCSQADDYVANQRGAQDYANDTVHIAGVLYKEFLTATGVDIICVGPKEAITDAFYPEGEASLRSYRL